MGGIRITGGAARGRLVEVPKGISVRPTSARVREAMFNILGPRIADARVLDLFAGAGTLGLEALSRGAAWVDFVDRSGAHVRQIASNLDQIGLSTRGRVHRLDVELFLQRTTGPAWDVILVDPPYDDPVGNRVLPRLRADPIIAPGGILMLEHPRRAPINADGWEVVRTYPYGNTAVTVMRPHGHTEMSD